MGQMRFVEANELLLTAWDARTQAYAPYSKFPVGAALLAASGKVYVGCNVENLSYGLTICAERNALFAAVATGERRFLSIAIVSDSEEPISPCGACRQVLIEFCEDLEVISENLLKERWSGRLSDLLPRGKAGILDKR